MYSEQFQSDHDNIYSIGISLLQYLQEVQAEHEREDDGTKGLKSLENEIGKSLKALKEQKYQVAVIAAMKAGKSTFLNVLIGEDILASESEACTVCRTDIRPIHNCFVPRLLEYREGQREPIVIVQGKADEIRNKFLERTHTIRATKNCDKTIRFELEHPIEAISKFPSLSGFTLVDTPGPNEWEAADFSTIELKKIALEALRTCDAILFILDYSSFKDNTNSELLQELLEQRKEALQNNTGKIYFILNKVDRKTEKDRPIDDVIEDLKQSLLGFGIPNPIVYPASAWQGLLSKLIQRQVATKEHKADFKKFFLARYIKEDEDGELYVPKIVDAAYQALIDSNIPTIEESVLQTVVLNSGWNLLSDALNKLDKAAKAFEDILNTRISGWEIQLASLKQKVEEYKKRAELARNKVDSVKESVEEQKSILIEGFSQGIWRFADSAKDKIEEEILKVSEVCCSSKVINTKPVTILKKNLPYQEVNVRLKIPDWIPFIGGISFTFETKTPLVEALKKAIPISFDESISDEDKGLEPYKIRVKTQEEGEQIVKTINNFCSPHIYSWWIVTQDKLINDGNRIREELVQKIQRDIQVISNELSNYLGEALQVDLNINSIHFPSFDFPGIDAQIKKYQEVYQYQKKNDKYSEEPQGWCEKDEDYNARKLQYINATGQRQIYEVDLLQICQEIKQRIDTQASGTQIALQRVIEKQIKEDFKNAEQQIYDYIERFQTMFDNLIKDREMKEGEREKICTMLEIQKAKLSKYLHELSSLRLTLNSWRPIEKIK